jgi:hypothetical protein
MERLSGVPLTDLASIRSITTKDPETVLISGIWLVTMGLLRELAAAYGNRNT